MIRVLFVCMGNICRSPTAHGMFRHLVAEAGLDGEIDIDSAGTHGYHADMPPDRRAQAAIAGRGIDISDLRARLVSLADFEAFDYILAMDDSNYEHLMALAPASSAERVYRFMDFARRPEREVPDPYYGGRDGFDYVLTLIDHAARGLLEHIRQEHRI
jgi:protein-tyrosine phosphatase